MKETGIIMSGDHPELVLDGRKTQTRRVIKPQPTESGLEFATACGGEFFAWQDNGLNLDEYTEDGGGCHRLCSYGQVGDRLIIKETWATGCEFDHLKPSEIPQTAQIYYLCDDLRGIALIGKTRSARFMCEWMSRTRPVITEVRVERQLDITLEDAIAEGFGEIREFNETFLRLNPHLKEVNPWVWAISFKKVEEVMPIKNKVR